MTGPVPEEPLNHFRARQAALFKGYAEAKEKHTKAIGIVRAAEARAISRANEDTTLANAALDKAYVVAENIFAAAAFKFLAEVE